MELFTIGYQGRTADELLESLHDAGVTMLVDVRQNPISRIRGFSKSMLMSKSHDHGVAYVHERRLGNPKEFRQPGLSTAEALQRFEAWMNGRWESALEMVNQEIASGNRVCLLCMEHDANQCHRSVVANNIKRLHPGLLVHHL